MQHRVFVYGTLLSGMSNHHWLAGAHFVARDRTAESLLLVDLGHYPAALERPGAPIHGEVWQVDAAGLARLDELEGFPSLYDRRAVRLASGGTALIYTLRGDPEDHGMRGDPIPDGDYRAWLGPRTRAGEPLPD